VVLNVIIKTVGDKAIAKADEVSGLISKIIQCLSSTPPNLECLARVILEKLTSIEDIVHKAISLLDAGCLLPQGGEEAVAFIEAVRTELTQFQRITVADDILALIHKSIVSFKAGLDEAQASINELRAFVVGIPKQVLEALKSTDATSPDSIKDSIEKLATTTLETIKVKFANATEGVVTRFRGMVVAFSDDAKAVADDTSKTVSEDLIILRAVFKVVLARTDPAIITATATATTTARTRKSQCAAVHMALLKARDWATASFRSAALIFGGIEGNATAFVQLIKSVGIAISANFGSIKDLPTNLPKFVHTLWSTIKTSITDLLHSIGVDIDIETAEIPTMIGKMMKKIMGKIIGRMGFLMPELEKVRCVEKVKRVEKGVMLACFSPTDTHFFITCSWYAASQRAY
jgi:hypothetical protein